MTIQFKIYCVDIYLRDSFHVIVVLFSVVVQSYGGFGRASRIERL
jgi:hypothetical protein